MRVLILILTLILTAQISSAQKLQRAFDMIYKGGDTLAAQKILKKSLKKHREIYAAYYGLGLCAMSSNPKEAFNIFKKVDAKFRISAKDFKKYMLVNYGITRDSAVYKINEIAAAQLRRTIMKDSSERGFAAFIRTFKGCDQKFINRATVLMEEAAYREAKKDQTLAKAKQFTANYPYSRRLNYIMEFIDSVEYYKRLENGNRVSLFKYIDAYERGKLFSLKSERIQLRNSLKKEYYTQAGLLYEYLRPKDRLDDEFVNNWRKEVYYSGHWQRLRFLYDRLPHVMVDTMRQMYYAGIYAEVNFAMQELWSYYGNGTEEFYAHKDSIYDFYIRRGAPSRLALRRMQELYKDYMINGQIDSVLAVINRYEPLFPNFKGEIDDLKRLLSENKDSCRRVRLPDVINEPPLSKPIIKYLDVNGRRVPYIANTIQFGEFKLFDSNNRYPVISPDGTRLYLTHWDYKTYKVKKKIEYVHIKSGKRIVDEYVTTDTVKSGIGVCYSDFKDGRWQQLKRIDELFKQDSIFMDTISYGPFFYSMKNYDDVPTRIALQFVRDKSINAERTDEIGVYYIGEKPRVVDSVTTFTSGISADNNVMYVVRPEKLQWGTPRIDSNDPRDYVCSKVVEASNNMGPDKWSEPRMCGKLNHYYEAVRERNPHPYFGSMNAHPSPDNKTLFFAAGREGVPGYREGFTVPVIVYGRRKIEMASAELYMHPFDPKVLEKSPKLYSDKVPLPKNQPRFYPDLWFSVRDENGLLGYPVNLGPDVNTEYGEYSPVLAADNKTLYFVSNGRTGIGGTDIYMCKRMKDDSWAHWSAPVNLGKYINTPYDEHDFSITADGKTAYYTSEEPLTHRQIVYKVDLPMIFRPDTIAIYKGKIINLSGEPVNATIRVNDDLNKRVYAQYRTQPNGEFYFGLPQDRPYRFVITAKNCASATDTLGCSSAMSIVKRHDWVLPDSVGVFEKHLPFVYDPEDGVSEIPFLKNYDIPALEITIYEPYKSTAEARIEDVKKAFASVVNGEEDRITTVIKVGKSKVEVRVLEEKVGE